VVPHLKLKDDKEGRNQLAFALKTAFVTLDTFGRRADDFQSIVFSFYSVLGEYESSVILESFALYMQGYSAFPTPALLKILIDQKAIEFKTIEGERVECNVEALTSDFIEFKNRICKVFGISIYNTYFKKISLISLEKNKLLLEAETPFLRKWIIMCYKNDLQYFAEEVFKIKDLEVILLPGITYKPPREG